MAGRKVIWTTKANAERREIWPRNKLITEKKIVSAAVVYTAAAVHHSIIKYNVR